MNAASLLIVIIGTGLTGCDDSSFRASDSSRTPAESKTAPAKPQDATGTGTVKPKDLAGNENPEVTQESGEKIGKKDPEGDIEGLSGCATNAKIEDANATYTVSSNTRAGDEITAYVNGLSKYTNVSAGAMNNDPETAKIVCNLYGYQSSTSTVQGDFKSPSNNNIAVWNAAGKNLLVKNAVEAGNKTIKGVACKGKLVDQCRKDPSWIFKK